MTTRVLIQNPRRRSIFATSALALTALTLTGCATGKRGHTQGQTPADWANVRAQVKTQLAADQLAAGNVQEAAAALREARELDGGNPALLVMQAQVQLSAGETEKAEQTLSLIKVEGKGRAQVEYLRGVIWQQRQRLATALEHFRQAALDDPDDASYPAAAAQVLLQSGKAPEAVQLLESGRAKFEWLPQWQVSMAEALEQCARWVEAAALWRKLAGDGDDPLLLERLAISLKRAQRWEEAVAAYGQLWQRLESLKTPVPGIDRAEVSVGLAECLMELGQTQPALETLQHIMKEQPRNAAVLRCIALVLARSGSLDKALAAADEARRAAPKDPAGTELFAALAERCGQHARAVAAARELPADNPIAVAVLAKEPSVSAKP